MRLWDGRMGSVRGGGGGGGEDRCLSGSMRSSLTYNIWSFSSGFKGQGMDRGCGNWNHRAFIL